MGNFIVYKHTSPSGKCYVGITSQDPKYRWGNNGCKYLEIRKNGKLKHPYFAQAILKYGWDNIKHELLHNGLSKEEACKLEQKYIMEYKSQGLSYNITDGGEGVWGFHFSEEQREKLRKSNRGKKQTPETVAKRVAKNSLSPTPQSFPSFSPHSLIDFSIPQVSLSSSIAAISLSSFS